MGLRRGLHDPTLRVANCQRVLAATGHRRLAVGGTTGCWLDDRRSLPGLRNPGVLGEAGERLVDWERGPRPRGLGQLPQLSGVAGERAEVRGIGRRVQAEEPSSAMRAVGELLPGSGADEADGFGPWLKSMTSMSS